MKDERKTDIFENIDVEDIGSIIEKYDTDSRCESMKAIRDKAFKKAGLEKPKAKIFTLKRLAIAACICLVFAGSIAAVALTRPTGKIESEVTVPQGKENDVLMLAVKNADEGLINKLLKNKAFVSSDVLDLALKNTKFLSYTCISEIAGCVYDVFGTTGLDPLVERTLLGDSEGALYELSKKSDISSYSDRLAFFFAAAFCNSEVVDAFAKKGADLNDVDDAGNNIYEIALKYGNSENKSYAETRINK